VIIINKDEFMRSEPVGKLLMKLSIPAMVGAAVSILFHLVDMIFIGRGVSVEGIGAVTMTFPIMTILMSIAMTTGSGGASMMSRYYGEGSVDKAFQVAGNIISTLIIAGVMVLVLGELWCRNILKLLGAGGNILQMAETYFTYVLLGVPFMMVALGFNAILQSEGRTKAVMRAMVLSTIINFILDYVFIFQFNMGIGGAALATAFAQVVWFVRLLMFLGSEDSILKLKKAHLIPKISVIQRMLQLGSSVFIRQAGLSLVLMIMNYLLVSLGYPVYVSIFGVVQRIIRVVMIPIAGLAQGVKPIIGFNFGAGNLERVRRALKLGIVYSCILGTLGFLILYFMPELLLKMFSQEASFLEEGKRILRIIVMILPVVGVNYIGSEFFLALGEAKKALLLGVSRQILFLLPLMVFLPRVLSVNGVFYAFPISDLCACILSGAYIMAYSKRLKESGLTNMRNVL
jgi:putative MATE family efflux protein